MAVRRALVDGIEIVWEERGAGPRPLVLLHGFTGTRRDFATQWDALAAHGRTLVPDLRGHGESGRAAGPGGYTLEALVAELGGWLDAAGAGAVDLLGHSMGGMVALRFALAHPERVASLILMDTSARALEHVDRALLEKAADLAEAAGMEALFQVMRARAAEDPERPGADRRVERAWGAERFWAWRRERLLAMDPAAYRALGRAMLEVPSLLPRLGEIGCPTLVLVGAEDTEFLAPSDELAHGIRGATFVAIPGAAHQPQHEAPESWYAAVRAHLEHARAAAR